MVLPVPSVKEQTWYSACGMEPLHLCPDSPGFEPASLQNISKDQAA